MYIPTILHVSFDDISFEKGNKQKQAELDLQRHERDRKLLYENEVLQKQSIKRIGKILVCMATGYVVGANI